MALDRMAAAQAGQMFTASTAGGTGKAPVIVMPTTTAQCALFNGNVPSSNICLVIAEVSMWIISGTAGLGGNMIACVSTQAQAALPGLLVSSTQSGLSAKGGGASKAILANAITLAGAPAWMVLEGRDVPAAIEIGASFRAVLDGMIIVPPQFCMGLAMLSPAGTTPLWGSCFVWQEVAMLLG